MVLDGQRSCSIVNPKSTIRNPKSARRAATSQEDKALIQKLIIQAITGFFAAGLLSSKPSLHALLPAEGDGTQPIDRNFYGTMGNGAALSVN